MRQNGFISAFRGMRIWERCISGKPERLFLLFPEYDPILAGEVLKQLDDFLSKKNKGYSDVTAVYSEPETGILLPETIGRVRLTGEEMRQISAYYLLTCRQHGICFQNNVIFVNLRMPYAGQLEKLAGSGIYSVETIVKEYILYPGG